MVPYDEYVLFYLFTS